MDIRSTTGPTMAGSMIDGMAKMLLDNVDEMADILRIDVGDGERDDRIARLFAGVLHYRAMRKELLSPAHFVDELIQGAEADGKPFSDLAKEIMATSAMEAMHYWDGYRRVQAVHLLWQMFLEGGFPHEHDGRWARNAVRLVDEYDPSADASVEDARKAVVRAYNEAVERIWDACPGDGTCSIDAVMDYVTHADDEAAGTEAVFSACRDGLGSVYGAIDAYEGALRAGIHNVLREAGADIFIESVIDVYVRDHRHASVEECRRCFDRIRSYVPVR